MTTADTTEAGSAPGAYGLRLAGLESLQPQLIPAPETWPRVTVSRSVLMTSVRSEPPVDHSRLDAGGPVTLHGVRLGRNPLAAHFDNNASHDDAAMIHPGLATVAAVINRWLDRDVFHAGAFCRNGGAWALLGAKEAGKSSLLGMLAAGGHGVVTDDVLVLEHGWAMAGPRCIDLRAGAAQRLGVGTDIGLVGRRHRWRMAAPPISAMLPLRGWILPVWGDAIKAHPLPARQRLGLLHANLAITRAPLAPLRMLELCRLPFLALHRPRRWESARDAMDTLLDAVDRHSNRTAG
jgi:hypothetical protein